MMNEVYVNPDPDVNDMLRKEFGCCPSQSDMISRQAAIDTEGLDEEIRCQMCKNPMKTDKGCDGNCKYDENLYEKIIQILDRRIKALPSAQPEHRPLTEDDYAYCAECDHVEVCGWYPMYGCEFKSRPSAHPEIIRCKDCKHKPSGSGANHDISFPDAVCPCQCEDYWYSWMPKDDWFCGSWERREE